MINLLPPQYKKELALQETFRLLLVLAVSFLIFLVCFILMLSVVRIYVKGQIQSEKFLLELPQKDLKASKDRSQELKQANADFATLLNFYKKRLSPTTTFEHISADLPLDVSLASLSISSSGIVLEGFAPTRELLLTFRGNLQGDSFFQNIDFPLTNLVNSRNINFSIRMNIHPNQ